MSLKNYFHHIQQSCLNPASKARIFDGFYKKKHRVGLLSRWISYSFYGTGVVGVAFFLLIVLGFVGRDGSEFPGYKAIVSNELYTRYIPTGNGVAQASPLGYVLSVQGSVTFSNGKKVISRTTNTIHADETIVLSSGATVEFLIHPNTKAQIIGPAAFQLLRDPTGAEGISGDAVTFHVLYGKIIRVAPYIPTTLITNPTSIQPSVSPPPSLPNTEHHLIVKTQDVAIKSQEPLKPIDILISVESDDRHTIHNAGGALVLEKKIDDAVVSTQLATHQSMTIEGGILAVATPQEAQALLETLKDQSVVFSFTDSIESNLTSNNSTNIIQKTGEHITQDTTKRVMSQNQHELFTQGVSPNTLNGYIHRLVTTHYNVLPEQGQRVRDLGVHIQSLYRILELDQDPDSLGYYTQAQDSMADTLAATRQLVDRAQEVYFIPPTPLRYLSGLIAWLTMLTSTTLEEKEPGIGLLTFEEIIIHYNLETFAGYLILR